MCQSDCLPAPVKSPLEDSLVFLFSTYPAQQLNRVYVRPLTILLLVYNLLFTLNDAKGCHSTSCKEFVRVLLISFHVHTPFIQPRAFFSIFLSNVSLTVTTLKCLRSSCRALANCHHQFYDPLPNPQPAIHPATLPSAYFVIHLTHCTVTIIITRNDKHLIRLFYSIPSSSSTHPSNHPTTPIIIIFSFSVSNPRFPDFLHHPPPPPKMLCRPTTI